MAHSGFSEQYLRWADGFLVDVLLQQASSNNTCLLFTLLSTVMFRLDDRLRQTLKASHPAGTGTVLS